MMNNNNNAKSHPAIGVMLMICITVILASIIAAAIFGMSNAITPKYNATITVKYVTITNGNHGIIDTNNNGYYFDSFHSFKEGNTYYIVYYVASNKRFIISETEIDDMNESDLFRCKYIDGVCK
jgi:hypothetical protein